MAPPTCSHNRTTKFQAHLQIALDYAIYLIESEARHNDDRALGTWWTIHQSELSHGVEQAHDGENAWAVVQFQSYNLELLKEDAPHTLIIIDNCSTDDDDS